MTIIYQTTEDDADDTVVPRFNSAGGDGENLIFIKEDEKTLSFGDNRIREAIEKYNAKLLILDPLSSYIGENCSMNNANETRAEFNHLIAVAKDTGCAIVIIAHMNKMKDNNPLYRTNGSIDIAGAARSILAITRTPNKEAPAERYLVQVKSNLAPTGSAILFEVAEKGVNFISEMEMTAEEAFLSLAPQIGRPNEKEMKAKSFLIEMLQGGEMLSSDCEEKLEAAGFKKSTIKKAKKNAGVEKVKEEYIGIYFEEHKKKRLDIDDAKRRGKLQESSVLANLRKLRGVEILSAAKLTKIEQDMANLKVCYELTPTELKTTHICPHCHYNLGDQVPNVAGQLDNLDIRIDDLVTEWTQTLLNTISDPIVASQKECLSAEQQKAIDDFIASGTLPKRVDDFFIKAIQALLKGFEPVVVDAKDLMDKLTKLPPMDEVSFKQKLNELIAGYTKGKDEGKLRIIVK